MNAVRNGESIINHPLRRSSPQWLARKQEDGQWEETINNNAHELFIEIV